MAEALKLIAELRQGARLSCRDVRKVLEYLGYLKVRQKGSHEQWIKGGRTFTLACHGKDAPWYALDILRKMVEELDGKV